MMIRSGKPRASLSASGTLKGFALNSLPRYTSLRDGGGGLEEAYNSDLSVLVLAAFTDFMSPSPDSFTLLSDISFSF